MSDDRDQIIQTLLTERDELKLHCARLQGYLDQRGFPPGHFYSPVVDIDDIFVHTAVKERLSMPAPAGIEWDEQKCAGLMTELSVHYPLFPFPRTGTEAFRFYYENPFFGVHDAIVLFCFLLECAPKRVIEVGCGFSSRLLLDVDQRFFGGKLDLVFIDPAASTVLGAMGDVGGNVRILSSPIQAVDDELFDRLEENDILFVDSSHVAKTGSDVNHYLFRVLPRLRPGVLIHIHDIFYPFEYLDTWVLDYHRSWNEAYALKAFLQYNSRFRIVYWNNFAYHRCASRLKELMPLCLENEGGSIWIRKGYATSSDQGDAKRDRSGARPASG